MISRRSLLVGTAALPLGGCKLTFDQAAATVSADVQLIASALPGVLTNLLNFHLPWLTPDKVQIAQNSIAGVQQVAASIGGATQIAMQQDLVRKLETYIMAFVAAIPVALLPPPYNVIVSAAVILLPVIFSMVNLVMTPAAAPVPVVPLTTDQARTALATPAS